MLAAVAMSLRRKDSAMHLLTLIYSRELAKNLHQLATPSFVEQVDVDPNAMPTTVQLNPIERLWCVLHQQYACNA